MTYRKRSHCHKLRLYASFVGNAKNNFCIVVVISENYFVCFELSTHTQKKKKKKEKNHQKIFICDESLINSEEHTFSLYENF